MFKAVIMDMDGTLYDTERVSQMCWDRACREMHCDVSKEDLLSFRGRPVEANAVRFASMKGTNGIDYYDLRGLRTKYFREYLEKNGVPMKKGLFEFLNRMRDHGIVSGIATGTARDIAERYWADTCVTPYVQFSICGLEGGRGKPEPDCYATAAKEAAKVFARLHPEDAPLSPDDCAVVEDAEAGVISASKAGCHPIVIPDLTPPTELMRKLAYAVCGDLTEAADIILKGN